MARKKKTEEIVIPSELVNLGILKAVEELSTFAQIHDKRHRLINEYYRKQKELLNRWEMKGEGGRLTKQIQELTRRLENIRRGIG